MRRIGAGSRAAVSLIVVALTIGALVGPGSSVSGEPVTSGVTPASIRVGRPTVDPVNPRSTAGGTTGTSSDSDVARAIAASPSGTARVVVTTHADTVAESELSVAEVAAQRAAIDHSLARVDDTLDGTRSRVVSTLDVLPSAVAEIDRAGLAALRADPSVESITLDHQRRLLLDSSTGVIRSDRLNATGVLGNNWEGSAGRFDVVIIDTGVARTHNALAGRVVSEACYSGGGACPNGSTSQTGLGSARPCTFSSDCKHGTHVAGTAAGRRYVDGHEGVARGAGIVAIRLGHRGFSGAWTMFESDLHQGLQRVLSLVERGRRIAAVNISLGGGAFTRSCATADPTGHRLTRQLRRAGVAVIAAAGNDGFLNAVSWPACLPYVYAVSAADDADEIALFTNSSAKTSWWAPGVSIVVPVPGGPNREAMMHGTSMAAPHVTGAFALLRECPGNTTPAAVADDLRQTGPVIVDEGRRRRRIDVFAAATRNVGNDRFVRAAAVPSRGTTDLHRSNVCASEETGEPGVGTVENSVWFRWTPARSGRATISTEDAGTKGTTFDTELTMFRGSNLGSVERVAYDNNSGAGLRSRIIVRVAAGVAYRIRVDGVHGQNGRFNLHVVPPSAP